MWPSCYLLLESYVVREVFQLKVYIHLTCQCPLVGHLSTCTVCTLIWQHKPTMQILQRQICQKWIVRGVPFQFASRDVNPPQIDAITIRKMMGTLCCGHLLHGVRHGRRRSAVLTVRRTNMFRYNHPLQNRKQWDMREGYWRHIQGTRMPPARRAPFLHTQLTSSCSTCTACVLFRHRLSTPMTLVQVYHRRKGNSTRYNTPVIPKA